MFPGVPPAARVAIRHRKGALFSLAALTLLYLLYHTITIPPDPPRSPTLLRLNSPPPSLNTTPPPTFLLSPPPPPPPVFPPGPALPPSTKALVIAHTLSEPVTWIHDPLSPSSPSTIASTWTTHLYTTDSLYPLSSLHTPLHKGREALAYLTHIIDHYPHLADVTLFLHAHRTSWHDDQFALDTPTALSRLNLSRVVERGYMNLRCAWEPGCPDHIHPAVKEEDANKPEQAVFERAWGELFDGVQVPGVLSQACCAQFGVSRERVWRRGVGFYTGVREWLMRTGLEDGVSGRVMEYVYQYIWTGNAVHCPDEHECYCKGYGIC
ncbi:hypothetical protein B0T16DRAFT_320535, partial [Cercophora newfieldiana]